MNEKDYEEFEELRKELEGVIKKEEFYRILASTIFEGVAFHYHGKLLFCNESFTKIFGYKMEELIGKDVLSLISPSSRKKIKEKIEKMEEKEYEAIGLKKDGETFIGMFRGRNINYKGKVLNMVSVRDITEEKENKEKLEKNQKFLQGIFDTIEAFLVILDSEGRIVKINKKFETLTGIPEKKIIGKFYTDVFVIEEEKSIFEEIFYRVISGMVPVKDESSLITKNGEERIILWSNSAITNEKGEVIFVVRTGIDITNERKYFQKVKESEEKYRTLAETILDGIVIIDFDGNIIFANRTAAEMFGFKNVKEILKRNIFEFICEDFKEKAESDMKLVFENKGGFLVEYRMRDREGVEFWIEGIGKKIHFEGKDVDLLCLRDITDRKLAEESLKISLSKTKYLLSQTVTALSTTIGERDPYTAEHQKRVASLATAIAKEMGFSENLIEGIRIAALLHDIGKISIPAEILSKPRKLTEIEMNMVKNHPREGVEIIKFIEFPWPIHKIILQHHERLNGSGYPEGLKGDEILLEARILAVADVVEAMSSHRPYRPALGIEKALEEIKKNKGILYDPDVVDACIRVFEKGFKF
ncbi:PAS domain S-box protein [bacterium]|nr:PAS domain S-box protein [bacterium]